MGVNDNAGCLGDHREQSSVDRLLLQGGATCRYFWR